MSLLTIPSIMDSGTLAGAEAAHHFASVLLTQWTCFWQRNSVTVLADLNADIPKTLAVFNLNTQAAQGINPLLDALNDERFPRRAPESMPDGYSFNGTAFVYVDPQPDPTP